MTENLIIEKSENGIITIILNRPKFMNCMNLDMVMSLKKIIEEINYDDLARVVIITGADPPKGKKPSFSAGADLIERKNFTDDQVRRFIASVRSTFLSIENARVPVIAAINGYAFGGGLELALSCDLRIASTSALMGLTETSLGIIPGGGGTQRLPRIVGFAKAKELVYTARKIGANEAFEIGLVSKVVEPNTLFEEAKLLAKEISENAPIAVQQAKFSINNGIECSLGVALLLESKAYEITIPTSDRKEALAAFSEKRKPKFIGK